MKKPYECPTIIVEEMRIERGFAASEAYGVQQFKYDVDEANPENVDNTAW